MQEGGVLSYGASRAQRYVGRHEEDGYGTRFGRERRRNRGSRGRTGRAGEGEGFLAPDKGEIRTEEGKEICARAMHMATHAYTRNPESPLGKKIDQQQWETLIFKGEHTENEHWRLVEDRHGQVGYAPAAFLVVVLDTTAEEEEGTRGQYRGKPDWRMDWTGGRTKEELFSSSDRWHQEKL